MTSAYTPHWWRRAREGVASRLPMSIRHVAPTANLESAAEIARRRRVVGGVALLGTEFLGISFSARPGSKEFYGLTAAVAATWTAGGLLSGPLHLGWIRSRDQRNAGRSSSPSQSALEHSAAST